MSSLTVYHENQPEQPLKLLTHAEDIASTLAEVGVRFERWEAAAPIAAGASQDEVIAAYAHEIERLKRERGYITVDVVSLNSDHPQKARCAPSSSTSTAMAKTRCASSSPGAACSSCISRSMSTPCSASATT